MYLKRAGGTQYEIYTPRFCAAFVGITCDCVLLDDERRAVNDALFALEKEMRAHPPKVYPPVSSHLILTVRDEVTLGLDDLQSVLGCNTRLIVLRLNRLRECGLRDLYSLVLQSLLEELCHIHYSVDDERLVNDYVIACARQILPRLRYEEWYRPSGEDQI